MAYVCMDCKCEFDSPIKEYDRATGYNGYVCPVCGSDDIEETAECIMCGAVKLKDSMNYGICLGCIQEVSNDWDQVAEYGKQQKECVELNGLYSYTFSVDEIELALMYWLMTHKDPKKEAYRYATDDIEAFSYFLRRKYDAEHNDH